MTLPIANTSDGLVLCGGGSLCVEYTPLLTGNIICHLFEGMLCQNHSGMPEHLQIVYHQVKCFSLYIIMQIATIVDVAKCIDFLMEFNHCFSPAPLCSCVMPRVMLLIFH